MTELQRFPVPGIAIAGKAGSGKSTLGVQLQEALSAAGYPSQRVAFGDALKFEVAYLYGLTKADPGGRRTLVSHGEERRLADPCYWIDHLRPIVEACFVGGRVVVLDDLRFPLELHWARALGFATVRLEAPAAVRAARLQADGNETHIVASAEAGETALDGLLTLFDAIYYDDDGSLSLEDVAYELVVRELAFSRDASLRRPLPEPPLKEEGEALGLPSAA